MRAGMDAQTLKTAKNLVLKANDHLPDPSIPYKYQIRGILMMLMRPRMILGDDVGIGKTIQSIISFSVLKSKNPQTKALVLTEKGTLDQWLSEFEWLTKGIKVKIITADTHPDPANRIQAFRLGEYDVVISTYSSVYDYSQYVLEGLGDRWVLYADEPNYFKNLDTMLHRNMYGMVNGDIEGQCYRCERKKNSEGKYEIVNIPIPGKTCVRAYGLTATIIENRLEEAFGIMRIITPGIFPSKKHFEDNYCVKKKVKRGIWKIIRYKNLDKFRAAIEPVFYGRLQDDPEVEQELPEVIFKDLHIELPDKQGRKLIEATDRLIQMPDGEIKQVQILPSLILAQQIANDPRLAGFDLEGEKIRVLIEMLQNSLAGERVFIWSKFRSAIDLIEESLIKANVERPVRITGSENEAARKEAKRRFMSDDPMDRANILLGTRAAMKGLNLQKGGFLIFFDLPWSYGAYRQIIGRLKRTGSSQKRIAVFHLMARLSQHLQKVSGMVETIDHLTLQTVRKKFELWQAITGDILEIESVDTDATAIFQAIKESKLAA